MQQPYSALSLVPTCPTDGTPTPYALAVNAQYKRGARHYNVHRLLHKLHTKVIVSWLLQTYRLSDNCPPVLKSQVYQEYIELCQKKNLVPIHNSVFGKILKQVFPRIQITRCVINSTSHRTAYHYCNLARNDVVSADVQGEGSASGPAPPTPHCLAPALAPRPQHPLLCVPEWACTPTGSHLTAVQPIWPDWHGAATTATATATAAATATATAAATATTTTATTTTATATTTTATATTTIATATTAPCTPPPTAPRPCPCALALPHSARESEQHWADETHQCLWDGLDRLAQDLEAAVASADDPTPALLADTVIAPLWRWWREHAHLFLATNARLPVSPVSCARMFSCVRRALTRFADTAQARLALQAGRSPLGREGFARQLNAFAACFRDAIWRACVDDGHIAFLADNVAAASTPPMASPSQVIYMLLAAAESVADVTQVRAQYALSAISSLSQQP